MLNWDNLSSVNVHRFDEDHKQLFSIINGLHSAMAVGAGSARVGQVMAELTTHIQDHFSAEDTLMEKTGYPELAAHRLEHQQLTAQFASLQKEVAAGKFVSSVVVAEFLDKCLKHTRETDKKYSAHLNANGIF
jgi:hemerythrin